MRFQVWLLTAMLVSLCTPSLIVSAIEVDEYWPSKLKYTGSTATETLTVSKRFLRVIEETKAVDQPNTLDSIDEERGFTNVASKVAEWVHMKMFQAITLVAGRSAANKIEMKLVDHVYLPILYRMKTSPDYFLNRAKQQVDPVKRATEEKAAKVFAAWIAKYHPK